MSVECHRSGSYMPIHFHGILLSCAGRRSLRYDLPGVELDQHGRVSLQIFHRNGQPEVVEHEKLELQMVQLS